MAETAPTPEKTWHEASCHCGTIKFKVLAPPLESSTLAQCNCSICTKNGYINIQIKREDVVFHQGYDNLKDYRFASKKFDHKFCSTCGSSIMIDFLKGMMDYFGDAVSINVRMFKDIDLTTLKLRPFDGKNLLNAEFNEK
ncbi:hypothetical protein MMC30_005249 [Trapelia coarctata]|nr:hypothetical protein [Trapelia coarctata]